MSRRKYWIEIKKIVALNLKFISTNFSTSNSVLVLYHQFVNYLILSGKVGKISRKKRCLAAKILAQIFLGNHFGFPEHSVPEEIRRAET